MSSHPSEGTIDKVNHALIDDICRQSLKSGFINEVELCHVLGADSQYKKFLPDLWQRYQLDLRGPKNPKTASATARIGAWSHLLTRLTKGLVAGISDGLKPVPYLQVYRFNQKAGRFEKDPDQGGGYIKLNELKEYFSEYLEIPVPLKLFPLDEITEEESGENITSRFENAEEYFPEINIHILRIQAERWVKKFREAPIERISLYPYSPIEIEGEMLEMGIVSQTTPMMYAVVFKLDADNKEDDMSPEELLEYEAQGISGQRPLEPYERLYHATKPNKRLSDNEQYHDFMTRDFTNVYKWPVKDNYPEEWHFTCKFKNTELNANIKTDEPFVVLWRQNQPENNFQTSMVNLNIENSPLSIPSPGTIQQIGVDSLFPELNIPILQRLAKEWHAEFPTIQKVMLFKARSRESYKYMLYFVEGVADLNDEKQVQSSKHFNTWVWDSWEKIQTDLMDAYKSSKEAALNAYKDWFTFSGKPGDSILYESVIPEKCCVLYPASNSFSEIVTLSPENLLDDLLEKFNPDVEIFYAAMKRAVKDRKRVMHDLTPEIAGEAYRNVREQLKYLQENDINQGIDYGKVETPSRDIKGQLLRNLIFRINPHLYNNRNLPVANYQSIGNRYRKIAKNLASK